MFSYSSTLVRYFPGRHSATVLPLEGREKGKPKINNSYFIIYRRGQELKNAVLFLSCPGQKGERNITWIEDVDRTGHEIFRKKKQHEKSDHKKKEKRNEEIKNWSKLWQQTLIMTRHELFSLHT
jgi:hypothetical protein